MAQTAGSGLQDIRNILDRMRTMAEASSDEALDDDERSDLNDQFQQLKKEVDLIAGGTNYDGFALLNGDASEGVSIEIDRGDTQDNLSLAVAQETGGVFARQLGKTAPDASSLEAQSLATTTDAQRSVGVVEKAIEEISRAQSHLGADETRLQNALQEQEINVTRVQLENTQARNLDFAEQTANTAREQILQQSGAAVLAQAIGLPQVALGLLG
jgi:flagellin